MLKRLRLLVVSTPCLFLAFTLAPSLQAPLVARTSQPVKPMKVWWGNASWYGPTFQGRTTASGELYDMTAYTAAHTSLPFGSIVRVINTRNGRSTVVRINDRGPYVDGREMDLSYQAAARIGLISRGVARLRMELLEVPQSR